jgi:arylsulfatase A-like enzyme
MPVGTRIRRRSIAAWAFAGALIAATVLATAEGDRASAGPISGERPSFVVVMTDDQGLGMMRALPSVRRLLEARGVSFETAIVSYPLCCPSRASFLTGQYAHNHGAKGNSPLSGGGYKNLDQPGRNLAAWLRAGGYDTAFVGKWLNGLRSPREAPPGWDEWAGLVGAGGEGLSSYYDFDVFESAQRTRHFASAARDYQTDALTREYALPFIADRLADADPFFLWLALHPPHDGLGRDDPAGRRCSRGQPDQRGGGQSAIPPPRYARLYRRAAVPRSPSFNERDLSDKPAFIRRRPALEPSELEKIATDHRCGLAALRAADDAVAEIVAELRRVGRLESTTIIFTSDQGLLAGEHRLRGKNMAYEEAIRVPLLVRSPGAKPGSSVSRPVANVDLAPTILELAGVRVPSELERPIDGVSLAGVIRGEERPPARAILIEGRKEPSPARSGRFKVRSYVGVRTGRYTYVEHRRDRVETVAEGIALEIGAGRTTDRELYDLRRDPFQLESRARHPAYAPVRRELAEILARLEDCSGVSCAVSGRLSERPGR